MEHTIKQIGSNTVHHIQLVREKALNALLPETFHAMHAILDTVKPPSYVILTGRGRAFCAGGDVRALRTKVLSAGPVDSAERVSAAHETLKTEYDFLERLSGMRGSRVVTVGVADGYAFGAGAGLFQACAVRLATRRTVVAMPEVKIGLIPDCGASHFYCRMPGCVGMYAAMTGSRIVAAECIALKLADGGVEEEWCGEGLDGGAVSEDAVLKVAKAEIGTPGELGVGGSDMRRRIDAWFSGSLEEILSVGADGEEGWARDAVESMKAGSPSALRECYQVMKNGYSSSGLSVAVKRELAAEAQLCGAWDFEEGVRAVLVDKTNDARWRPL